MDNKLNKMRKKVGKSAGKFCNSFLDGDFVGLAAELSFYLLSTFLPMVILIFTVASAISRNYSDAMINVLGGLPDKAAKLLIKMLVSKTRSTTVIAITGAFSLFTMSGFINTIEKALHRFYKIENNRSFWKSQGISLVFAFFIYLSIIASFGLIIFGRVIAEYLFASPSMSKLIPLWNSSRYVFILIFIIFVVAALFKALPCVKLRIRDVIAGAAFTTVGWYVASMLFALYVNNFPQYEIIYGSLAGFACIIMWIYITGIVMLCGAKINSMIYCRRTGSQSTENDRCKSEKSDE